jgi:asparagine N-glycosylation enzyme membrane subunit Stt3
MMEKVGPVLTMERWEPIFWIVGLCLAFFAVLMVLDYIKTKKKRRS